MLVGRVAGSPAGGLKLGMVVVLVAGTLAACRAART